ncbi:MAG TPA: homoserine dehydrogenase [Vicinamibacterales bacterium]|jgi:homoserine dehydrogenase|nr:homoserine dehydrogenase [Vicinamibacterales bacterium]
MGLNTFQTSGSSPTSGRSLAGCPVAILGFGPLGQALARRLTGPDSPLGLQLTHICDRRAREKSVREPESIAALNWTDRFDDLLTSDVHVIVEAVTGAEPAADYVRAALLAGKAVVTVNKQIIAHHGPALLTLAERQGRQLRYEGAVGGAMPIVRVLGDGLSGERLTRIDAILNGTSNAVLSRMEEAGCGIDEAIAHACALGYADADPSADLDGHDAAAKLAILCGIGLGLRVLPAHVDTRTTMHVRPDDFRDARQRGGTVRQIAHAERGANGDLTVWVAPRFVPAASLFARTFGPGNAAILTGRYSGETTLTGTGTGADALAVAMLSDLVAIARDRAAIVPAPIVADPAAVRGLGEEKVVNMREAV